MSQPAFQSLVSETDNLLLALAAMFGGLRNYLGKGLTAKKDIYALYEQEGPYTELKVLHAFLALLCKRLAWA